MARRSSAFSLGLMLGTAGFAFGAGALLRGITGHPARIAHSFRFAQAAASDAHPFSALLAVANTATAVPGDKADVEKTLPAVYQLVEQYYVDDLPPIGTLSRATGRAMLAALGDPNCYYVTANQRRLLENEATGHFAGIGAVLTVQPTRRDGYTDYKIVVFPLPGSPAEKAGLRAGDVITHIDRRFVMGFDPALKVNKLAVAPKGELARSGIRLATAQMLLRGDEETIATFAPSASGFNVTVQRPRATAPLTLRIPLGDTEAPVPAARSLAQNTVYLRVPLFTRETPAQVQNALQGVSPSARLVLDLRQNAGGESEAATQTLERIAPGVRLAGQKASAQGGMSSHSTLARPVAVLLDEGTGGAAEAVAVSLAQRGAATVGSRTSGNPVLQTAFALSDGTGFVLATGRVPLPHRADGTTAGLTPSVPVLSNASDAQVLARAVAALNVSPARSVDIKRSAVR